MIFHINVFSSQVAQRSKKFRNDPIFFTHSVTQIMAYISLTGYISPKHLSSSMATSFTGFPVNNPKIPEVASIWKQDKCTQLC